LILKKKKVYSSAWPKVCL